MGQPLRASIAYALNPNEQMFDFCIFLKPGLTANGIPALSKARITITESAILLNGRTPLREPLLAMQVSVNCPYTAHLARDYTLMIDPAPLAADERVALSTDAAPLTPVQVATVTASDITVAERPAPGVRAAARPQDETPIAASSRYRVQPGDSLSQIAARIENRSIALWPAVDAIFAANPDAFLDNDRNLLKAGSWLVIPDLTGRMAVAAADESSTEQQDTNIADAASSAAYAGVALPETSSAPAQATEPVLVAEPAAAPVAETAAPEMRPGDVIVGTDDPFVVPFGGDNVVVDIPDTALEAPQVSQPAPVITSRETGDSAWSWLAWLGGTGLALILGLLLFGRQLRDRFGSVAVATPAVPSRRRSDQAAARPVIADIDFEFDENTLNSRAMTLDADLDDGTGLQGAADMDVAQDFGFSASGVTDSQFDLEITEHAAATEEDRPTTEVIPPSEKKQEMILENEVLPSDDDADEDYSVSMMVDATKEVLGDNTSTTKDLQAVLLATDVDIDGDTSEYSLSKEVDYQILEQDYEDELTATQALNKEIEEAARALVERMDNADTSSAETAEMPVSPDPEMTAELTANLPASGDAQNEDFGDTSVDPDMLVEMPLADGDATIDVESVSVEPKKSEAS